MLEIHPIQDLLVATLNNSVSVVEGVEEIDKQRVVRLVAPAGVVEPPVFPADYGTGDNRNERGVDSIRAGEFPQIKLVELDSRDFLLVRGQFKLSGNRIEDCEVFLSPSSGFINAPLSVVESGIEIRKSSVVFSERFSSVKSSSIWCFRAVKSCMIFCVGFGRWFWLAFVVHRRSLQIRGEGERKGTTGDRVGLGFRYRTIQYILYSLYRNRLIQIILIQQEVRLS